MPLRKHEELEVLESVRRGVTQKSLAEHYRVGKMAITKLCRKHGVSRPELGRAGDSAAVALAEWEPAGSMPTTDEIAEACQLIRQERARREMIDESGLSWTVPEVRSYSTLA